MESLFNASYIIITLLVDWTFKKKNSLQVSVLYNDGSRGIFERRF